MNYLNILKKLYLGEMLKREALRLICVMNPQITKAQSRQVHSALLGCMNGIKLYYVNKRIKEILE